jgi:hypothetical protein
MKAFLPWLMLTTIGFPAVPEQDAASTSPLATPAVVLCLRPLRLAQQPGLPEAVESVRRLTALAKTQEGTAQRAVDALIFIFKDLFQKEQELVMAEKALVEAENRALAKEKLAQHTESVGSKLSGPNPRLAQMFRQEAADLRSLAISRRDEVLRVMKEKIIGYNQSAAYFQSQGDTEVVIALASSLYAVVDRRLPGFEFNSKVSRAWIVQQKARM